MSNKSHTDLGTAEIYKRHSVMVEGGAAPEKRFVPYGTPCSELFDPQTQKVEKLRCELDTLRRQLDMLLAEQEEKRDRA